MSRLEVGVANKGHGLKGDLIVRFTTDRTAERTASGAELFFDDVAYTVTAARSHGVKWILSLRGLSTRDQADELSGAVITAEAIEADGEVFVHQVIGKSLIDQAGVNRGEIVSVLSNPASDLMELATGELIPMTFYVSHDDETVRVEAPDGLWDLGD